MFTYKNYINLLLCLLSSFGKILTVRQSRFVLISLLFAPGAFKCPAQTSTGVTNISITSQVLRQGIRRIGMNMGGSSFWDASLITRNLIYRNPGFEGMLYQSTVRCKSGTA